MPDPRAALDAIGQLPDVEIDIAGAALQFARIDAPDADWQAAARHLSESRPRRRRPVAATSPSADVAARAGALAGLITGRHRYAGDTETYDDPANANLIHVAERRRGLPVALGILWLHCTRAVGWGAHGVDFPGHFLLALEGRGRQSRRHSPARSKPSLDVFAGGVPLDAKDLRTLLKRVEGPSAELRPGVLAPMSARRVLLRLQENIRVPPPRRRRRPRAPWPAPSTCSASPPTRAALWRDAAAMHQRLDQVAAALRCYARLLDLVPEGDGATRARIAMDALRSRLN